MRWIMAFLLAVLALPTWADVQTREVTYDGGGVSMKGMIAWDNSLRIARPAVLVVHEWWGHNDYARERARQLAAMGYVAMSVDMYGDGKTADHPKDAMSFMTAATADTEQTAARFNAAIEVLKQDPHVDSKRIGAIGYCFGGAVVLNMARRGADLKGVASFHGALAAWAPAKKDALTAQVLVLNGADDPMVSKESISAFDAEMKAANANFHFINYAGATHGFTNPDATAKGKQFNMPLAYDAEADKKSWDELQRFLMQVFR